MAEGRRAGRGAGSLHGPHRRQDEAVPALPGRSSTACVRRQTMHAPCDLHDLTENTMTSITMPITTACTDPAMRQLVADYIALHDTPTAAGIARLFTPGFTVHGPSQAEGMGAQGYLAFLQSLQGLRFRQAPGAE